MPQASRPASRGFAGTRDMIENPGDLRGAEIGIEPQARLLADHRLAAVGAELVADAGRAAILPDDRGMDRLAGRPVPDDDRLALIGDADARRRRPTSSLADCKCLAGDGELRRPDLLRIVLDPAGLREELVELALRQRRRSRRARRTQWPATKSCLDRGPGYTSWRRLPATSGQPPAD